MFKLSKLIRNTRGASAAEYALILAIIGAVIAIAAIGLSSAIGDAMNRTSDCIEGGTEAACTAAPATPPAA